VEADRRFGARADGLVQLLVLAVGAPQGIDNKLAQPGYETRAGRYAGSQLDVQFERLPVGVVVPGNQMEFPAYNASDLIVLQGCADALRKDLQRVEGRGDVGTPAQCDERRVFSRHPYRELVTALIEKAHKLGRGHHSPEIVDAVANQRK
jgi:hypothetical protein